MKSVKNYLILLLLPFILFSFSCKKDLLKPISVTTGNFTDNRDGRVYKTTTIGDYTWLAENLDFAIPSGSCYYNNDSITNKEYGRLYTWQAAQAAIPPGWHLPSYSELKYLDENLGGERNAGSQMKETGNSHWVGNNDFSNNYSELSIIPGGEYDASSAVFKNKGSSTYFWDNKQTAWSISSSYYNNFNYYGAYSLITPSDDMLSARCVKNY